MAVPGSSKYKDIPLIIAGSNHFGRYDKMSNEETFNMFVSDQWLITFAGYRNVASIDDTGEGRGIYSSSKLKTLFAVIDDVVYKFDNSLSTTVIGHLTTFIGDVFITENNVGQILFSDSAKLYLYDANTNTFSTSGVTLGFTIDFIPGYVTFQNGRFISPATIGNVTYLWALSDPNNGLVWPNDAQHRGSLQTKADTTVACVRVPGRGNLLYVYGSTVAEQWQDQGSQLFPYQRSQSTNMDYGCINPATISDLEYHVCWIGINEKSGPVIMYSDGGEIQQISTDGINYKLANLAHPENCYGFMFKQDGHLFYVVTWPSDRLSYAYDFNTKQFYTLCDENMNAFIAKRVAFFNNQYYFVSIKDGNLYQLSSQFISYDYGDGKVYEIPRIRITPSIQLPDQSRFLAAYSGFTIEQGQFDYPDIDTSFELSTQDGDLISTQDHNFILGGGEDRRNNVARIDLSLSKDGGVNFGSNVSINMRPLGVRQNRLMWYRLGSANDLCQQFRFWGFGRFVAMNGITGITQ